MSPPFDYSKLSEIVTGLIAFRQKSLKDEGALPPLSDPFEEEALRQLRSFGRKLADAGGLDAMFNAADAIEHHLGAEAANILNYAWDGISGWFA